jgi:pyruvate carboxylase
LPAPTGRVYRHEIPGGQLSNLRQQAIALGLGRRFEAIEETYAAADAMLGRLVKVTPSSKVVGDLALHLVGCAACGRRTSRQIPVASTSRTPSSGSCAGELGDPPGGWPEPFRSKALAGRDGARRGDGSGRRGACGAASRPRRRSTGCCSPARPASFERIATSYGDVGRATHGRLPVRAAAGTEHVSQLEPGVELLVGLEAIGEPDERGMRTVMTTLNGQLRPVSCATGRSPSTCRSREGRPGGTATRGGPVRGSRHAQVAQEGDSVAAGRRSRRSRR